MQYLQKHQALPLCCTNWSIKLSPWAYYLGSLPDSVAELPVFLMGLGLPCRPHHTPLPFGFVCCPPLLFYLNLSLPLSSSLFYSALHLNSSLLSSSSLLFFCSIPLLLNSSSDSPLPCSTSPLSFYTSPPSLFTSTPHYSPLCPHLFTSPLSLSTSLPHYSPHRPHLFTFPLSFSTSLPHYFPKPKESKLNQPASEPFYNIKATSALSLTSTSLSFRKRHTRYSAHSHTHAVWHP